MEIEFDGKTWAIAGDEFADPYGPVAQLTAEAVNEFREAEKEGRTEDAGRWKFTAEFLLKAYWYAQGEE